MISLSADVSIDPALDLWGKTTADLQSNISISNDNVISGTLNYIDDYSSAFGPDLDSGHYIAQQTLKEQQLPLQSLILLLSILMVFLLVVLLIRMRRLSQSWRLRQVM